MKTKTLPKPPKMFDWFARWHEVERAIAKPHVQDALNVVMNYWCNRHGTTWDSEKGPAHFADRQPVGFVPSGEPVDRYRCWGFCYGINTWAGVVGRELVPSLTWEIAHSLNREHFIAIGFKERHNQRQLSLILDLLWGIPRKMTAQEQEEAADRILDTIAPDRRQFHLVSIERMLERMA